MTALTLPLVKAPPVVTLLGSHCPVQVGMRPTKALTLLLSRALPEGRRRPTTAQTLPLTEALPVVKVCRNHTVVGNLSPSSAPPRATLHNHSLLQCLKRPTSTMTVLLVVALLQAKLSKD